MENFDFGHSGEIYSCNNEALAAEQLVCLDRLYEFNHTRPTEGERRETMLREMFAEFGDGSYIEPPFHSNWGGKKRAFR